RLDPLLEAERRAWLGADGAGHSEDEREQQQAGLHGEAPHWADVPRAYADLLDGSMDGATAGGSASSVPTIGQHFVQPVVLAALLRDVLQPNLRSCRRLHDFMALLGRELPCVHHADALVHHTEHEGAVVLPCRRRTAHRRAVAVLVDEVSGNIDPTGMR